MAQSPKSFSTALCTPLQASLSIGDMVRCNILSELKHMADPCYANEEIVQLIKYKSVRGTDKHSFHK